MLPESVSVFHITADSYSLLRLDCHIGDSSPLVGPVLGRSSVCEDRLNKIVVACERRECRDGLIK